jgi:hypothetical protein
LQPALVFVNSLMVQGVLADDWADRMTPVDHRGLTLLF